MRAREFIRPVNEQQLDEFLPALGAAAGAVGRAAMAGGAALGRGALAAGRVAGQALAKGTQAAGRVAGQAVTKGAQAAGKAAGQAVGLTVGQAAVQQLTPQQQQQQKQQEIKSQQSMANTLPQLKNLGININPQQAQQALNKVNSDAPLSAMDKDNIAKLGPAVGNIIRDPKLAPEFKALLQKSQQTSPPI